MTMIIFWLNSQAYLAVSYWYRNYLRRLLVSLSIRCWSINIWWLTFYLLQQCSSLQKLDLKYFQPINACASSYVFRLNEFACNWYDQMMILFIKNSNYLSGKRLYYNLFRKTKIELNNHFPQNSLSICALLISTINNFQQILIFLSYFNLYCTTNTF